MRKELTSKFLIFAALIFAAGYSYKNVDADVVCDKVCQDAQTKRELDAECNKEKMAYNEYLDKLHETCPANETTESCAKEEKNCAAGYVQKFNTEIATVKAKLYPDKTDDDGDADPPDPNAKIPQEGDAAYCNPDGSDPGTDSSTDTTGKSTPTECETASLSDKMNHLDADYKEDKALVSEKQNDYLTAVAQGQADQAKCAAALEDAKSKLAAAQGEQAALPAEERQAISGISVQQQALIQEAQAAEVVAQSKFDAVKVAATAIETKYSNDMSDALTFCRNGANGNGGLQGLANANMLNRGQNLSNALGQAQGGITSNRCQTDFIYQQAAGKAWRAYIVTLQQNQADYMQAQAGVALAQAHIVTVANAGTTKDKQVILDTAKRAQALQTSIASLNSALTSQGNICSSQSALNDQKMKTAMDPVKTVTDNERLAYCQEDYLHKKFHGVVTGKKDDETKHLEELHKANADPKRDPCLSDNCGNGNSSSCPKKADDTSNAPKAPCVPSPTNKCTTQ